ncbi:S8 family peptidase [Streptosporangium saharense]|uniref:Subtilisin family serine protease n=1 Tax=Streptosporangium saharense TaxID=1706840 RepID=A0A7W7QS18_9ACTN|nr:S8 family serine peptidase [Streptosporangium saharense]MBB4918740.1 subtilisin family serine protease [Streptosporangium saharense]
MRLRALVALVIVLSGAPAVPAHALAALAEEQPPPAAPKLEAGLAADEDGARAIVELAAPAQADQVAGEARSLPETDVVLQPGDTSFIVVQGTGESLTELAKDPRVVSIRRDRTYSPSSLASGLTLVGADRAHAEGADGRGTTIAVVDTGVDAAHPALGGKVVRQACFSVVDEGVRSLCQNGQGTDTSERAADATVPACVDGQVNLCEHGTHVTGIAHAVAPGADIVAVQVFSRLDDCDDTGAPCITAYESSLLLAMEYLTRLKDTVPGLVAVNMSLGGGLYDGSCDGEPEVQEMKGRLDALRARGVTTVAAAGNEGSVGAGVPGCLSGAVTVGATDDADRVPEWSNHGSVLDLFAPGVEVDSSVPGGGIAIYSGTSMSTPHVTGALAVLAQRAAETGADASADALTGRLTAAGRPIAYAGVTVPRLDLYGALTGTAPSPGVTQEPGDPVGEDPSPDPGAQTPPVAPTQAPEPIPLPTVTVTVTVTASPVDPAPVAPAKPAMCVRGTSKKTLSAAGWAAEFGPGKGTLTDATLRCYLGMVGRASRVFPELTGASTPATARKVLKPAKRTKRSTFESELLAAWLNWANGSVNLTAKVSGTTTVRDALTVAEDRRLRGSFPSASASLLSKRVNARRT